MGASRRPALLSRSLLRRFVPRRQIGSGGEGTVFLVDDLLEPPSPKALKIVRARAWGGRPRLRREFDLLRRLRHPNLVRVFDFGEDRSAGILWFTSEFVAGPDLFEASAGWRPRDLEQALELLADTLEFLHGRGLVHGDLKSSNVRVPAGPRSARLLDFGLASLRGREPGSGGTPRYMAPERLLRPGATVTGRADLWSLGVLFYRCATRRFPFEGDGPADLLTAIAAGPQRPRLLRADLPHHVETILLRLLARDPVARHRDAGELVAEIGARSRAPGESEPGALSLPSAPIVGRERLLGELRQAFREVTQETGAAGLVLLGEPGIGKSRILEEWKQELQVEGKAVVAARAERGSPRPWGMMIDLVRRLAALPGSPPPPEILAPLLFPGDPASGRSGLPGTRELLLDYLAACSLAGPLAVLCDDLHWGDPESVDALVDLAARRHGSPPLLLVATVRDDESSAPLRDRLRDRGARTITLGPLSEADQRVLLASLFPGGGLPEALLSDAVAQAAGNPLALEEAARAWLEAGAVRRQAGAWWRDPTVPPPRSGGSLEIVSRRLRALGEAQRAVLDCVALHGRPLPRAILESLRPGCGADLEALRRAGILVAREEGIDVRHPLQREAALDLLPEVGRRSLHLGLGEALERAGAGPEDLWEHLLRGGDPGRGIRHALAAGTRAEAIEDFRTGRTILEAVLAAAEAAPKAAMPAQRLAMLEALGRCLQETGERARAVALLEQALAAAPSEARPRLLLKLGYALYNNAEHARALETLAGAQQSAVDPDLVVEAAHHRSSALTALGRFAEARAACVSALPAAAGLERNDGAARLPAIFYMQAAAQAYNQTGLGTEVDDLLRRARAAAERAPGRSLRGYARSHEACHLMFAGRLRESLDAYAEAERLMAGSAGSIRWLNLRWQQGCALQYCGEHARAIACLRDAAEGTHSLTRYVECLLVDALADACDPEALDRGLQIARRVLSGEPVPAAAIALGAGFRCALWAGTRDGLGDLEAAVDRLAPESLPRSVRHDVDACVALRALWRGDGDGAAARLEQACREVAAFAPVLAPRYRFWQGYALALAGRPEEAARAARSAADGWEALGNRPEAARASVLAQAVAQDRTARLRPPVDFVGRIAEATDEAALPADLHRAILDAVVGATEATAAWLLAGPPEEPRVLARAGPCGAADPLAWHEPVGLALGAARSTRRPGVGAAFPVALPEGARALCVEDRSFPQAFSDEAAPAAELAARRVLEAFDRRRLRLDLAAAQAALAAVAERPTRPTARSRSRRGSLRDLTQLVELTLGPLEMHHSFDEIVGRGRAMRKALETLDRVIDLDTNVLVIGETGTGKELVARALHDKGPRAAGPFVAVNCSTIPVALAESEFFGHHPGAFTGAARSGRKGLFEQASGGTLFLDEIGELDPALQAKLLRALEEGEIRPLGGDKPVQVDVRMISATNVDLREATAAGRFRSDLYFRLAVVDVRLPPLRERPEDIPSIVKHLLPLVAETPVTVAPAALDALAAYSWPGNVRELRNVLERAVAFASGGRIEAAHLSPAVRRALDQDPRPTTLADAVASVERRMIAQALEACGNSRTHAAQKLGITRMWLHVKMKRLGLAPAPRRRMEASRPGRRTRR